MNDSIRTETGLERIAKAAGYLERGDYRPTVNVDANVAAGELYRANPNINADEAIVRLAGGDIQKAITDYTAATRGSIGTALNTFAGVAPDVANKVQTLANHYGTDYSFAEENQQDMQSTKEAQDIFSNLTQTDENGVLKYPLIAGWIANPSNMVIAKEDVAALHRIEDDLKDYHYKYYRTNYFGEDIVRNVGAFSRGVGTGIVGAGEGLGTAWAYQSAKINGFVKGQSEEDSEADARQAMSDIQAFYESNKMLEYLTDNKDQKENVWEGLQRGDFRGLFSKSGSAMSSFIVGMGTPNPVAATYFGVTSFSDFFNSSIARGDSEEAAYANATSQAGIAAFLMPYALRIGATRSMFTQSWKRWAQNTAAGTGMMELMGITQEAVDFGFSSKKDWDNLTSPESVTDWIARRGESVLVNGLLFSVINAAHGFEISKKRRELVDYIIYNIFSTKFASLKPEMAEDLVGRMIKSIGIEDVASVKAKDIETFFQDANDPTGVNRFLERNNISRDSYDEALQNDGAVNVRASKLLTDKDNADFVSKVGRGSIPVGREGISLDQIKELSAQLEKRVNELKERVQKVKESKGDNAPEWVKLAVSSMMKPKEKGGNGMTGQEAAMSVMLLQHTLDNLARMSGEAPEAMYKRLGLEVKTGGKYKGSLEKGVILQSPKKEGFLKGIINKIMGVRGSVSFQDGKTVINLYRSADLSTFLHESFHVVSREYRKLAEAGMLEGDNLKNFEAVKAFTDNFSKAGEEAFARAGERYLMSGKAPSKDLIPAFREYKRWLTSIYKDVFEMEMPVSEQVKAMFERVIASEDEIAAANKFYQRREEIAKERSKRAEMTEDELLREVEAKSREVEEKAVEAELKARMTAYKEAIGGKSVFLKDAVAEVEGKPVYASIDEAVKSGGISRQAFEMEYGKEFADKVMAKHEGLLTDDGSVTLGDLAARAGLATPDEMIGMLETLDGKREAVRKLASEKLSMAEANILADIKRAGKDGTAVLENASEEYYVSEARLNQKKIFELEGKSVKEGDLEISLGRKKLLIAESKDNLRNLRLDKTTLEACKYIAFEEVMDSPIKDATNPKAYIDEAERCRKAVNEALKRGDGNEANKQNLMMMIAKYKAKYATDAIYQNQKFDRLLNQKRLDKIGESLSIEFKTLLGTVAQKMGINADGLVDSKVISDVMENNPMKWFFDEVNPSAFGDIAEWIRNGVVKQQDKITLSEKSDMYRAVKVITGTGREDRDFRVAEERAKIDQMVQETISNSDSSKLSDVKYAEENSILDHCTMFILSQNSYVIPNSQRFSLINGLHQQKTGEIIGIEVVGQQIAEASATKTELLNVPLKAAKKALNVLDNEKVILDKKMGADVFGRFSIPNITLPEKIQKAGFRRWTADKVLGFMLHCGNASNIDRLLKGYGLQYEDIQKVSRLLSPEALRAIDDIWRANETLMPKIEEQYVKEHGERPEWIAPDEITLESSTGEKVKLKGGYTPAIKDPSLKKKLFPKGKMMDDELDVQQQMSGSVLPLRTSVSENRLKARSDKAPPYPLELSFANLVIPFWEWQTRHIALQEPVMTAGKMMRSPEMAKFVTDKFGPEFYQDTLRRIADVANPTNNQAYESAALHQIQRGLQAAMSSKAMVSLGFKPISQRLSWGISGLKSLRWLDQSLGTGKGLKYMWEVQRDLRGWDRLNANMPTPAIFKSKLVQDIFSESTYMRNRHSELENMFKEQLQRIHGKLDVRFNMGGKIMSLNETAHVLGYMMNLVDLSINAPVWMAAKRGYMEEVGLKRIAKGEEAGKVNADAVALADKCIIETQPLTTRENISAFMRDKNNPLNLLFLFRAYGAFQSGNQVQMWRAWRDGIIPTDQYLSHVGIDMFVEPMAQVAFRAAWTGTKMGTTSFAAKMAAAPIAQAFAGIGGQVGMVASDMLRQMIGADKNGDIKINPNAVSNVAELPFIKSITAPATGVSKIIKGAQKGDEISTERGIMDLLDGLNFYYGAFGGNPFPVENLWREWRGMQHMFDIANPEKDKNFGNR